MYRKDSKRQELVSLCAPVNPIMDEGLQFFKTRTSQVDIRLRVKGGGFTGQIYALRQALHCISQNLF